MYLESEGYMMNRKYFFFDIDGTLAVGTPGDQYIPESTQYALKQLESEGHFIAIATGRSYAMAHDYMHELGFHNMISDGGNGITIDDQLIGIEPLDYQLCLDLIDECEKKGFIWAFSPDNKTRRLAPDNRFYEFTHDIYMKTEVVEGLDPRDYDQIYKVYIACFKGEEEKLESLKKLSWCRFHKEYLFVEPGDKSKGIKRMVEHLGGDIKDVVVFGDEKNDLSMFIPEWTSIAMGNGIDELKKKATYVTTDADKDGIYNACLHYGWIKERYLLALDMDGTLLKSDKTISPNTAVSLNEASNRGQSICLCTGRGLAELKDYEGELDFCDYGILLSGCLIYDFKNDQPLEVHSFDTDVFTQMMDIVKKEDVMLYLLDSSHSIASQKDVENMPYYNMAIYQSMFESHAFVVEDIYEYAEVHKDEILKFCLYNPSVDVMNQLLKKLEVFPVSCAVVEETAIEVTPLGITKGAGLEFLSSYLNIPIENTIMMGDSGNDIEAFQSAGKAIAMGNATEEIKNLATEITLDNDHDGIKVIVDKYLL